MTDTLNEPRQGQRHIAFVIPHPYVDALPCFREPIAALAENWQVDLYTLLSPEHPAPFFGTRSVRLVPIKRTRRGAVELVARLVAHRPKYRMIVTVPQWGLHYSAAASRLAGIPMGCISDEIKTDAEASTEEAKRWKARERRAHQACRWTIALSAERADFIRDENRLGADHRIFVVPNAARGAAARLTSHYFQDVLDVPPGSRILLHAGSLWWKGAADVIARADEWRSDWTVVFQNRFRQPLNGWRDSAHVRFATQILPASLLDHAVSSADVGLALYDTSCANNRLMGTASGKVARYLKNGLPVIATRDGGFDWIEREGCGVCVSRVEEIPAAADRIFAGYAGYTRNAIACFDRHLDFDARFQPVAEHIDRC